MNFIHAREYLSKVDVVRLDCDTQCNFMLTDDSNFSSYKRGGKFEYFGGKFTHFPAMITVPRTGDWNVTIDLGGGNANIKYNISYVKR